MNPRYRNTSYPYFPNSRPHLPLLLFALLLSGCATYTDDTEAIRATWAAGNVEETARLAASAADGKDDSVDSIVFLLEEGSAWRAAEQYDESNVTFETAREKVNEWDARAELRVGETVWANFTNLSYLPYTGYAYDRVMLHTYVALNYLAMEDYESARVMLNRALEAQREAVRQNAEAIAEAQAAAEESASKAAKDEDIYNAERALKDKRFNASIDDHYRYLAKYQAYADYVNPFTVYLDGLYFLAQATGPSDLERARKSFERVRGMILYPGYIEEDIAAVDNAFAGQSVPPTTWVLFETGMAPIREEQRIDIPLFIVSREVPYVGVAFPTLKFNPSYVPGLSIRTRSDAYETELLCSMDSVVAQEFENELPVVITRTLISAGTKALAQYGIYEATKDSGTLGALIQIAGVVYQAAMNQADLRTWVTLPKQFQLARLPTPDDRRLRIIPQGYPGSVEVDLLPGRLNVVYVKSNSALDPIDVSQFTLSPEPSTPNGALIQ